MRENILELERDYRMWLWGVIGIFFGGMGFCITVVNSNFCHGSGWLNLFRQGK